AKWGEVSVPALWSENGNFTSALKTVNKILQINKDDVTGMHCKVVCLIQTGSFREALNVINTCTKLLANNFLSFEKNALKTTESANQQTDKLKELYGQVLYRLECYDEYLAERKTNPSAFAAEKVAPESLGFPEGTHELCYNTACALIHGQLNQAMKILQKAEEEDQNVFDSKKKVKLTNAERVEFKLSKKQLQAIEFNKALLAMYTNQAKQCLKISAYLQSHSPDRPALCEKQPTKAIELLQEFSDQHQENAVEIKLTMAQSIEELKQKPGMVSALATMYSHKEDINSTTDVFTQAIRWYQNHQPKSPAHLSLIREAANFKLKYGQEEEAISDLEQLWKQNPKDIHTLAQLISAYSLVDPEKGKALSKHLPSSDSMSLKVDVEALENSPGATYIWKGGKVTRDSQPKEQGKGDLKKKKKGKLPKNYDPKVTPDPERWLPMKGKKKDQIGKGTQGATAGASSELDASKTVSSPPTSPGPGSTATLSASTSNIIPPRHQKPAGAPATKKKQQTPSQKKKKKGI
uniref:Signal recognition particle subunit SRP72 n=1 Tax=Rhinopithecus bieti TaxID=61621 RepID=A0A2K6KKE5_RHIBE